jgi:hypothetical protein
MVMMMMMMNGSTDFSLGGGEDIFFVFAMASVDTAPCIYGYERWDGTRNVGCGKLYKIGRFLEFFFWLISMSKMRYVRISLSRGGEEMRSKV